MKISACIISREPSEQLHRAIASVKPLVDEVIVVFNGKLGKAQGADKVGYFAGANATKNCPAKAPCNCRKGDLLDFASLRNYSFSLAADADWIFWLDSDDELECSDSNLLRNLAQQSGKNRFGFLYDYGGADIWNVRLVPQKQHKSEWQYPVHEILITENFGAEFVQAEGLVIRHKRTSDGQKESVARNLRIQRHWENYERWRGDARFHFYYGQALRNAGKENEPAEERTARLLASIAEYEKCVSLSGVPDEKYIASELCARLYIALGKYHEALQWAYRALSHWPERANGFILVGTCFYHLASHTGIYGYWVCSAKYFKLSAELVVSTSLIPMEKQEDIAFEASILYNVSLNNSGNVVEALHVAERAYAFRKDERLRLNALIYRAYLAKEKLLGAANELSEAYGQGSEYADASVKEGFAEIIRRLPQGGQSAAVSVLASPVKTIALVCGQQWQPWNPIEGAPGGSEIAICELSKRFAKRGYDVTVFTDPLLGNAPLVHDGVTWAGTGYCEDSSREFDVVIGWRGLDRVEGARGKRRVLWLHDMHVQFASPKRLAMIDFVAVNSMWHADQVRPALPGKRIEVLGAGLDPSRFAPEKWPVTRNFYSCVWASSWDRGLDFLLGIWPRVVKRAYVPDAKLHVLYGCDGSLNMARKNGDKVAEEKFLGWKKLAQQTPGVVLHGRVPNDEYDALLMSSGVYAYPIPAKGNEFGETFGVTIAEAVCAGLRVVASPRGALAEVASPFAFRQVHGAREDKAYQDEFIGALEDALTITDTNETRELLASEARARFDWNRVVDRWEERIFGK